MEAIRDKIKFKRYPAYKESGVKWLGEIPQHWEIQKGKWLFIKQERPVNKYDDIVTCFRDGQVTLRLNRKTEGFTNALKEIGYQGIRKGDLVIHNMDAFAGAIGVSDSDGKSTPVYSACTPRIESKVDPYFYAYLLRYLAYSEFILSLAKGIRERSTDFRFSDFGDLLLSVPPLSEQIAISSFLDRKTAQIKHAIDQKLQIIELLKERRQILIHNAVTKGLDTTVKMKDSNVEWLGEIPEHWEVQKLKYLGKIKYGLGQPPKEIEDGLPLIRATNVERGKIVEKGLIFVDPEDIPWDRDPELKENDIIVVRSGAYTADSAIIPKKYEGSIAGYDMVITPKSVNPSFLSFALLAKYILYDQLYLLRMRAAQPHLNAEELGVTLVLCPPLVEQQDISEFIELACHKIVTAISCKKEEIEKLKEYKATLINSAVTGKIKVC